MTLITKVRRLPDNALNWANVCSPNILLTVRRTLRRSHLACNEMQASVRTCGRRTADSMIENVGWSKVKSIYFNNLSQGNSSNYYLIMGPRDKAAPPTSQQIKIFPPKRVKNLATPSSIFIFYFFLIHRRPLLSANQRQYSSNRVNVPWTRWAKLFGPRI